MNIQDKAQKCIPNKETQKAGMIMSESENCNIDFWLRTVTLVCAFLAVLLGLLGLFSWALGFINTISFGNKFIPMAEETALLFIITGVSLFFLMRKPSKKISEYILFGATLFIGVIALLTLVDNVTDFRWNLGDILGSTHVTKAGIVTGRMSWTSAVCFLFVCTALLLLPTKARKYSVIFSSLTLFFSYVIVVGYSYGVPLLYGGTTVPMAWLTSIAFIFTSVGLLFAVGKEAAPVRYFVENTTRARLLRNILPLLFLVIVGQNFFYALTNKSYTTINSVTNSLVDVFILIIVGLIISVKSKSIGNSIDKNIYKRKQAEKALTDSRQQLRNYASNLQLVGEAERTNLAREIHDSLAQYLVALKIDIGVFKKKLAKISPSELNPEEVIVEMDKFIAQVDNANKSARMIMNGLRPEQLELLGFEVAAETHINAFMETHHINCQYTNEIHNHNINQESALALFRILQESLNNILKHSMATEANIKLSSTQKYIKLEVTDNGVGFDVDEKGRIDSYGIIGMKERVKLLDGNFKIESNPGKGTTISVTIPHGG